MRFLKDLIIELQKNLEFRNNVILHWVIAGMVSIFADQIEQLFLRVLRKRGHGIMAIFMPLVAYAL